jgi:predicted transcriptional regulator of viral defense system
VQVKTQQIYTFFEWDGRRVWSSTDLRDAVSNHLDWGLKTHDGLLKLDLPLSRLSLTGKNAPVRYGWREPGSIEVAMSLHPSGYLAYDAAAFLHALRTEAPNPVYLNIEQRNPGSSSGMTQVNIDRAFAKRGKVSNNQVYYGSSCITIVSGKNTGCLGTVEAVHPRFGPVRMTSLERTLIDLAVRPEYAGGPRNVLQAFCNARSSLSIETLASVLDELGYAYPYHQRIGFYLDQAGYSSGHLGLFREKGFEFDFYLDYHIAEPTYCQEWRIKVPDGLMGNR